MRINTFILHKDYTRFPQNYQLILPLDIEHLIPDDDSVRLLSQYIERMFLGDLYRTYCRGTQTNRHRISCIFIPIQLHLQNFYLYASVDNTFRRQFCHLNL